MGVENIDSTRQEKWDLKISQEQFTKKFLSNCGVELSTKIVEKYSSPAISSGKDANMEEEDFLVGSELEAMKIKYPFQSRVGSLWWLAQISRPDIYLAVHRASKFQNNPSEKLWRWILHIEKYLSQTYSVSH